jgi:predicted DNA binding CopG/RHH family protein
MVDAAIEVRLSDGDAKALREIAAREGVSPAEIIRRALRAYRTALRMACHGCTTSKRSPCTSH